MDLLGAAASIPQVLQPGPVFHTPLAHLDGASCAQDPVDGDKDEASQLQPRAPDTSAVEHALDWPTGWNPHQEYLVSGSALLAATPQSSLDPADLFMAREPQLPAASVLPASDPSCNSGVCALLNCGSGSIAQLPTSQETTDIVLGGNCTGRRKRLAAEMQFEGDGGHGACGTGPGGCTGDLGLRPSGSCHNCQGSEERPCVDTARGGPGSSGTPNNVHGSGSGAADMDVADGAQHHEREVFGSEGTPAAVAVDAAAAEPSRSPPDAGGGSGGTAPYAALAQQPSTTAPKSGCGGPSASAPEAGSTAVMDTLAKELGPIMARCGGVSDTRHAGRLAALVEGEERLGGRLTLLTVVQQSTQDVLRLFVQGTGLRSLERWVIQFRDEGRHPALVKVISCLKMLPIDLIALKGSSIGQTVGKLRKHTNQAVRAAAAELVDQWKSVVDRSVGKGEARQGGKSKADGFAQEGPNKRPRKQADQSGATAAAAAGPGSSGKQQPSGPGSDGAATSNSTAASSSKLAVMDDDLFVSAAAAGGSGSGGSSSHPPGQHRSLGLTSFITGAKKVGRGWCGVSAGREAQLGVLAAEGKWKSSHDGSREVHAMKLENVVPSRLGSMGAAQSTATAAGAAAPAGMSGTSEAAAEDGSGAPHSPTSPRGDGAAAGLEAAGVDGAPGPGSPKPGGDGAAAPGGSSTPSLVPLAGGEGPSATAGPAAGAGSAVPKAMTLPRLGTLAGPSNPTSAHARAMAARARAPSPEPAPRREKKKTVSWAGDDGLASYRLFKKDDPPQAAKSDAVLTAEDEAAATAGEGAAGFQSAARREHASERMALIAQHQQEEQERQQELERWAAMRPTVPWVEPPELYLGAVLPQQLPALGEDSTEREVQVRLRQHTPRVVYYSPSQIPPSPAEPPPEPEPDLYRVRHIPLNVPSGPQMPRGQPPHPGVALPLPYGGQLPPGQLPAPLIPGGPPPPPPPQQQQQQPPLAQGAQPGLQQGPPAQLTLPPDLVASLPALISTLAQQPPGLPHGGPAPQQPQQGGPGPGQGPAGPGPQGQPGPQPQGLLLPPHQHQHPHGLPHPHARGSHGGSGPPQPQGPQPGQPPASGPMVGAPGGAPLRPMEFGMQPPPPHAGIGPGPGPGPGRPGGRFEPGLGPGPGQGPGGPPMPPRKDGQPTVMRPRRVDEPPGPGPGPGPMAQPHAHLMGPGRGPRHAMPPHHMPGSGGPASHGMGPLGAGGGPGPGGWAPPPGPGGPGSGPPPGQGMAGPPPPGPHGPSRTLCMYFNTPGGCRNGESCRFLHVHSQDMGPPYDNGPYSGPGRSGMGMGRPGGGPPPGMPGGMRRR
ncbi:hypothetical protein VOLCADRAFT_118487 [Volvox carteri f. nagariensis]|uniref:Serine/threonine-protein phosphatase 1 regulatory subunit 10 n=1 Tax=Volvox carteri f. nagariensis TaxID=3068 RepID=D8U5D2_VOLCA|nr:uncharacterized protein VOLCADRAFT_118487 [Volvox carteri f. nagariensis]EFJ45194.1 hypothetical protein VOLCADRAFT_118487 [Volvox carteri f. nagariensis]|eukprot:XP_002953870.1 hypothetical protein VOLCADRAFT_118487 [Volvox carteri f. nagariensis]